MKDQRFLQNPNKDPREYIQSSHPVLGEAGAAGRSLLSLPLHSSIQREALISSSRKRTMKLSFSIPSKRKPSVPSKPSNNFCEYLTEFNSSKTLSAPNTDIIVPPKPNTFNPFKKMCGIIPDPSADSDLRFEIEDSLIADPASKSIFSYGLNLRNPSRRPQRAVWADPAC